MRNRLFDATDVVDFKYGRALGLGAKVEATLYLGAGFGLATVESFREWYGRHATDFRWDGEFHLSGEGIFAHLGFIGSDGGDPGNVAQGSVNAVALNVLMLWGTDDPPMIDRWRFGGEVLLPGALGGIYLNLGELYDFFAGLVGGDPAEDDGLPKR